MKSTGTLHVVGTPIGNVKDIGRRACEVLAAVDLIAAEDTRRTRGLLSHIGVEARVIAYHEHNEEARAAALIERLEAGEDVALVSDAGTPLISDPGWRLVRKALDAGLRVECVAGPSAMTAALSVAGQPTDRVAFEGFLPRKPRQRAERLRSLATEERTLVFFEAVHRIESTLAALVEAFGAERPATIARELTKVHEQVALGTLGALAAELGKGIPLLGEFVIVVGGNTEPRAAAEGEVARVYGLLSAELAPDRAVALCAQILGLARNDVYRLTRT